MKIALVDSHIYIYIREDLFEDSFLREIMILQFVWACGVYIENVFHTDIVFQSRLFLN